ncbi:MAG: LacI family DNA-binding transcriptional regulator [Acidobacteria bacterium]|nr:LacI family DNA-binding transcriptional regulator [Acidobacteriota bacterium]
MQGNGKQVGIKAVAKLAGTSPATVSRVLGGNATVRPDLVARVMDAVKQLNYAPNPAGRNLRVGGSRTVGMVVPDIENQFYTSVLNGADEVLADAGYTLILAHYGENPERERMHLARLRAENAAGVIFAPSRKLSDEYSRMREAGMPLVAVSRRPHGLDVDQVTVAERKGTREAVRYLLQLGHKRVGMVSASLDTSTARERKAGFVEAFSSDGAACRPELVICAQFHSVGGYHTGGYQAMQRMLALPERPTAVFVGSNNLTLGALQAIHESGIEIPSGIAVVGFDDMPWAASLRPALSVVAQPGREMGAAAARLLLRRIASPECATREEVLDTRFVVRESCG